MVRFDCASGERDVHLLDVSVCMPDSICSVLTKGSFCKRVFLRSFSTFQVKVGRSDRSVHRWTLTAKQTAKIYVR